MARDFTITEVHANREWEGTHGQFIDYQMSVADYPERVVVTQKPETPAPTVGSVVFGNIEVKQVNPREGEPFTVHKLKKERREDAQGGSSRPQSGGRRSDPTGDSIERQVAAKCAAEVLKNRPASTEPQQVRAWFDAFLHAIQNTTPEDFEEIRVGYRMLDYNREMLSRDRKIRELEQEIDLLTTENDVLRDTIAGLEHAGFTRPREEQDDGKPV